MPRKQVLIAGASGLVGYAAMRHFGADPDCDVIALSRRGPHDTHGARFLPFGPTPAAARRYAWRALPAIGPDRRRRLRAACHEPARRYASGIRRPLRTPRTGCRL